MQHTLDELVARYNVPGFIDNDPVQFPRRFSDKRDIEISAILTSIISWGRRAMILRNADKLHSILDNQPYLFVTDGDIDAIDEGNIHRTFFGRHLRYALRGLRELYRRYGSMEDFAAAIHAHKAVNPAWHIAAAINRIFADADRSCARPLGTEPTRCLPADVESSALKRFNMALRWLVRSDGIVDIGAWELLKPSQLFIPLDVHSGNTSRTLGLLSRKANDRRAVEELTAALRQYNADDPVIYDFALFGAGEEGISLKPVN